MAWMLSFAVGVAALWLLPKLLTFSSFALAASLLAPWIGLWLCWARLWNWREAPQYRRATVCALAALAGFTYAHWHAATAMAHLLPTTYDGAEFVVQGHVRGLVTRQALRRYDGSAATLQRFEFDVAAITPLAAESSESGDVTGLPQAWPRRLRLSSYREQQFTSGEYRHLRVRLRSPRGFANPGGFDLRRFMLSRRLDAYGYVRSEIAGEPVIQAAAVGNKLQQMRVERHRALQAAFAQTRHPQIYNALLLGDKSGLSQPVRTLLNRTGTAHLLAISGLHIGLAASLGLGFGYALLRCFPRLVLRLPSASLLALSCLPPAAFYAVLAGLAVPTQRALLMLGSFAVATLWQRNTRRFNHWCLAMFCVLLWQPLTILDSGFWLSFFAVATLLYCFAKDSHSHPLPPVRAAKHTVVGRKLGAALRAQAAICFGMPALLVAFGLPLPVVAPLANLLVVPIIACWVVPAGLAAMLASYASFSAVNVLLQIADAGLAIAMQLLALLGNFGQLQLSASAAAPPLLLATSLCLLGVLLGPARAAFFPLAVVGWLTLFSPLLTVLDAPQSLDATPGQAGEFTLTQFDVGQGTAVLVSTRSQHWLYDTGAVFGQRSDAGRAILLPALRRLGIAKLNGVVVSHGDKDHAGGAASLAHGIAVQNWYVGGRAAALASQLQRAMLPCVAGLHWQADGVRFAFIHPPTAHVADAENDRSCVLQVSSLASGNGPSSGRALLTGDISRSSERQLLHAHGTKLHADVLLVPHHGSKSSSSAAFVAQLKPRYALVSAGFNNRYRHPHVDVLQRYRDAGSAILRSDQLGAIQLSFRDGAWQQPRCSRYAGRFFWQPWNNTSQCAGRLRKP